MIFGITTQYNFFFFKYFHHSSYCNEIKYQNTLKSLNNTCQVCKSFSFNGGVVEDCIIYGCDAASLVISSSEEFFLVL